MIVITRSCCHAVHESCYWTRRKQAERSHPRTPRAVVEALVCPKCESEGEMSHFPLSRVVNFNVRDVRLRQALVDVHQARVFLKRVKGSALLRVRLCHYLQTRCFAACAHNGALRPAIEGCVFLHSGDTLSTVSIDDPVSISDESILGALSSMADCDTDKPAAGTGMNARSWRSSGEAEDSAAAGAAGGQGKAPLPGGLRDAASSASASGSGRAGLRAVLDVPDTAAGLETGAAMQDPATSEPVEPPAAGAGGGAAGADDDISPSGVATDQLTALWSHFRRLRREMDTVLPAAAFCYEMMRHETLCAFFTGIAFAVAKSNKLWQEDFVKSSSSFPPGFKKLTKTLPAGFRYHEFRSNPPLDMTAPAGKGIWSTHDTVNLLRTMVPCFEELAVSGRVVGVAVELLIPRHLAEVCASRNDVLHAAGGFPTGTEWRDADARLPAMARLARRAQSVLEAGTAAPEAGTPAGRVAAGRAEALRLSNAFSGLARVYDQIAEEYHKRESMTPAGAAAGAKASTAATASSDE